MKSVAELAQELNVSPQAIYKRLNGGLKQRLKPHVKKKNGKTVINQRGQEILKELILGKDSTGSKPFNSVENNSDLLTPALLDQLKVKDEQIEKLTQQNEHLSKILENMQVLLKTEQEKNILLIEDSKAEKREEAEEVSPEAVKRKSIWDFFK